MWTGKGEVRSYSDADIRIVLWYDTLCSIAAYDWILFYITCSTGGNDRDCLQPFQHGKPRAAVSDCDQYAFKKDEKGDTRCGEMVPSGILCFVDSYALCIQGIDKDFIDREEGQKIVDEAISRGINYSDTAHSYQNGDSERFLGEALSKYSRDSYFLATKFYVAYSRSIEKTFEEQLKRGRTDYFDFYLFHCLDEGTIEAYTDQRFDYLDWTLLEAKRQYEILTEHGIPVWVMEPMKGGRLSTLI